MDLQMKSYLGITILVPVVIIIILGYIVIQDEFTLESTIQDLKTLDVEWERKVLR